MNHLFMDEAFQKLSAMTQEEWEEFVMTHNIVHDHYSHHLIYDTSEEYFEKGCDVFEDEDFNLNDLSLDECFLDGSSLMGYVDNKEDY